jgi:dihydrofolate reductase
MENIKLCAIVAIAKNHVIGRDNAMIWHIPADLKHFKKTTLGRPIIMGRKSYESLGKPLPGRPNIVISRSYKTLPDAPASTIHRSMEAVAHKIEPHNEDGPFLCATIDEGIAAARDMARAKGLDEIFITGGGEIYKQTLPLCERLYLTVIERDYDGDTFFPEFDWDEWNIASQERHEGEPPFTFFTLERKT